MDATLTAPPSGATSVRTSPFKAASFRSPGAFALAFTAGAVLVKIGLSVFVSVAGIYEFHRDELLYLAMADHLDSGYLEVPPAIAVLAWLSRNLFGSSVLAARILPMLFGAGIVTLTALTVRELGGGRFATALAILCVVLAPVYLLAHLYLMPVVFEQFYWMLGAYLVTRMLNGRSSALWFVFGAVVGVGLLHKHSMLLLGFGVLVGLMLTRERRALATPFPWLGAAAALVIFAPNLLWQMERGWPLIEHMRALSQTQLAYQLRAEVLLEQVLILGPATLPVWLAGLFYLFIGEKGRWRTLAWAFVAVFAVLMVARGKAYYLAGFHPLLMAAGGVALERLSWMLRERRLPQERIPVKENGFEGHSIRSKNRIFRSLHFMIRTLFPALILVVGLIGLPMSMPVLPPPALEAYMKALSLERIAGRAEQRIIERIPQNLADMIGWEEKAQSVGRVVRTLPRADQDRVVLIAGNYGHAGALYQYRDRYQLPPVVSTNSSFYLWGPGERTGEPAVTLGIPRDDLERYYARIESAGAVGHPYARFFEREVPIFVCREPHRTLQEVWPQLRPTR